MNLKKFGISNSLLDDLCNLIINNKDYHNSFSNVPGKHYPVSPLFVNGSRKLSKQIKLLEKLKIHNVVMMDITTQEYSFKALSSDGELYSFSVPREINRFEVCTKALEKIILKFNPIENTK